MKNRNCTLLALALFALAVTATQNRAQSIYTPYAFTNFAGLPGVSGTNDGTGGAARFGGNDCCGPSGVAVDTNGSVYVADSFNHTIRKITPAGAVTTLAGLPGVSGTNDGTGSAARFGGPYGVAVDSSGNVYVAEKYNYTIRKITPAAEVTTLAGSAGQFGSNDGTGSAARFGNFFSAGPTGVAVDSAGSVYVADTFNNTIRKVTSAGEVTTLAGSAGGVGQGSCRSEDGTGSAAGFCLPGGVAVDSATNVYVADTENGTIRKITPVGTNWVVTTVAGLAGFYGSADGTGSAARFNYPNGLAVDSAGNVYVADLFNQTIRKITPVGTNWVVTTLAGSARSSGSADGIGSAARFDLPYGVAVDSEGNVYVADSVNYRITKGTPPGLQFDTSSLTVSNGLFQMRLIGPSGSNVVLEASSDLAAWTPIQTNALPPGGLNLSVPLGTDQQQFFRARLAP